jgi:hypothetical protein
MRKLTGLVLSLALVPAVAHAYTDPPPPPPGDDPNPQAVQPPTAAPSVEPPAPPAEPPPNDDGNIGILGGSSDDSVGILQTPAPSQPAPTAGQWVYTAQYGWVWMPYGSQYVDEAGPCAYVFAVGFGWRWVAAPWVWGWGAYPYFGVWGPAHFAWYRGLYRGGWGWGRYRGSPRFTGYGARYFSGHAYAVPRYSGGSRVYGGGGPRVYAPQRTYGGGGHYYGGGRSTVRAAPVARPSGGGARGGFHGGRR